jgi:hypothetical protein
MRRTINTSIFYDQMQPTNSDMTASGSTSADLRGAQSRQLSEVLETFQSNGRHSRV